MSRIDREVHLEEVQILYVPQKVGTPLRSDLKADYRIKVPHYARYIQSVSAIGHLHMSKIVTQTQRRMYFSGKLYMRHVEVVRGEMWSLAFRKTNLQVTFCLLQLIEPMYLFELYDTIIVSRALQDLLLLQNSSLK